MKEITKAEVADFCTGCTSGRFVAVKGYTSATKEVADFYLQFGCYYDNLLKEDSNLLKGIIAGNGNGSIAVKHGIWIEGELDASPSGIPVSINGNAPVLIDLGNPKLKNREAKGRVSAILSYVLPMNSAEVIAAAAALLKGIETPKDTGADYSKEGKGIYSLDRSDGESHWYLRDGLVVSKSVIQEGEKKFSASLPETAIKDAVRKLLKSGRYRAFNLTEGNFRSIKIEGAELIYDNGKFFLD
jgi:hypothetical protein